MTETAMERNAEEVRAGIARAREEIAESLENLKDKMTATTDWREWVRHKPGLFVAAAFAVGFIIGTSSGTSRRR
jgi:hypothetical protein